MVLQEFGQALQLESVLIPELGLNDALVKIAVCAVDRLHNLIQLICERHYIPHVRQRGEELESNRKNPRYRARRWVVERTHSWLNRFQIVGPI